MSNGAINQVGQLLGFENKKVKADRTKIALPAFLYHLESSRFAKDFADYPIPEGLIEVVKSYLKDNHPNEVRRSFGDATERKRLGAIISEYISSRKNIDRYRGSLGGLTHSNLVSLLVEDIAGFGSIDELFSIPTLTDININRLDSIWIDDYLHGPRKTNIRLKDMNEYNQLLAKIMNASNTNYSLAKPQVSGSLPRFRFDIVGFDLSEVPSCSIRIISKDLRVTEESFVKTNQGSPQMLAFFKEVMRAKTSLLVSGDTGAGKTELMRFLAGFIPTRIITMEDVKEMHLEYLYPEKNIASWVTRTDFRGGKDAITLSHLNIMSLRHFPDWIIIGETRGSELYHLVNNAQTGHKVMTGIHSHRGEALDRMITVLQDYLPSDENLYGKKLVNSIPLNYHVERIGKDRIITKVTEYISYENGQAIENSLFEYNFKTKKHEQVGRLSEKTWNRFVESSMVNLDNVMFLAPTSSQVKKGVIA